MVRRSVQERRERNRENKRLLARLQLNLPDAEQRLDPANGSLWDEHRAAPRLWHREIAEAIQRKCTGKEASLSWRRRSRAPRLRLNCMISRACNAKGIVASVSPRNAPCRSRRPCTRTQGDHLSTTDSRALPEDYMPTVKSTLGKLENPFARRVLDNNWVKPNKRIFNNAKVSDHFAIIPTGTVPHSLDNNEQQFSIWLPNVLSPCSFHRHNTRTRLESRASRVNLLRRRKNHGRARMARGLWPRGCQ